MFSQVCACGGSNVGGIHWVKLRDQGPCACLEDRCVRFMKFTEFGLIRILRSRRALVCQWVFIHVVWAKDVTTSMLLVTDAGGSSFDGRRCRTSQAPTKSFCICTSVLLCSGCVCPRFKDFSSGQGGNSRQRHITTSCKAVYTPGVVVHVDDKLGAAKTE